MLCFASCVVAPAALAAPTVDLGLGGVKVPQIDPPTIKPPSVDGGHITPPSVDLQPTVDSATNAVKDATGGGSGGSGGSSGSTPTPTPPSTGGDPGGSTPPSTGTPSTPTTPQPGAPTHGSGPSDGQSGGKSGAASKSSGSNNGAGASNGAANAGAAAAAKRNAGAKANAGANDKPAAPNETHPSTLIRIAQAFSWTLFGVLLAIAVLALGMTGRSATLARLTRKLKHQRGELTEDVGAMQTALLPVLAPRVGDTELSVAYRSVGPASGGDFHDVIELDGGRLGILVGDACGHGREALQTTALVHYTVRAYLEAGLQPREAIRLADDKVGGKLSGDFVTVICAIYDPSESALTYATAGHPAPIVVGTDDDHAVSLLTDPPIGVGSRSGTRQTRISVPADSELCFFSDGLSEARDEEGELIGRSGLVRELDKLGPETDAEAIVERVDEIVSSDDDVTVLVVRPRAADGTSRVTEDLELDESVASLGELRYFLTASGLSANQAQRTQTEAMRRAQGTTAHLRIHRGGDGETNWEFAGTSPAMSGSSGPVPHLELVMPSEERAVAQTS